MSSSKRAELEAYFCLLFPYLFFFFFFSLLGPIAELQDRRKPSVGTCLSTLASAPSTPPLVFTCPISTRPAPDPRLLPLDARPNPVGCIEALSANHRARIWEFLGNRLTSASSRSSHLLFERSPFFFFFWSVPQCLPLLCCSASNKYRGCLLPLLQTPCLSVQVLALSARQLDITSQRAMASILRPALWRPSAVARPFAMRAAALHGSSRRSAILPPGPRTQ